MSETPTPRPRWSSARQAASAAHPTPSWSLPAGASLGPAHVIQSDAQAEGEEPRALRVGLSSGAVVEATWAIPYRYEARPGDLLLVVGREDRYYALSVLSGRGRSVLAMRGAGLLRAEGGKLKLKAERGVRLQAPRVTLRGQRLESTVRVLQEKLGSACARIARGVFERAGASRRVIEGDDWHSAGARTLVAADAVTFNGDLIRVS